jgi:hypothetical protein
MTEVIQAVVRFTWAMSLLAVKQLGNMIRPAHQKQAGQDTIQLLDSLANKAADQLDPSLKSAFQTGDNLQRKAVDRVFASVSSAIPAVPTGPAPQPAVSPSDPRQPAVSTPRVPAKGGMLNVSNFVVIGEGLAAGMGDFFLHEGSQKTSFPAQMAAQMGVEFAQPLVEEPGIGNLIGFGQFPVRVPGEMQTTFLTQLSSAGRNNLAIPSFLLSDCLELRSVSPLVCRHSAKQTMANFVLGMPDFMESGGVQGITQLEYAVKRRPTFAIVELGYSDVLTAAVEGRSELLPERQGFVSTLRRIITALKEVGAEVMVMNVPNPLDTAFFSPLPAAAKVVRAEPGLLSRLYDVSPEDQVTVSGLVEIGNQLLGRNIRPLSPSHVLPGSVGAQITSWIEDINNEIALMAQEERVLLHDLRGFFQRLKRSGSSLCPGKISADFLGGFYSLNGYYPGATGSALLANDVLLLLNRTYRAEFPPIDVCAVMRADPVAMYAPATGPNWTLEHLAALHRPPQAMPGSSNGSAQTSEPGATTNLRLPDSLEQVLPLVFESSYFGEAIRAVNCQDDKSAAYGSCPTQLFGGLILVDSHLRGNIRIKFTPPVNDVTHFEVYLEDGLTGNDSALVAPNFYRFPFQQNGVQGVPGQACSGNLNLKTGEVAPDLNLSFLFTTTGLGALVKVNANFPKRPISFPGQYGSAWARFEQRPDGRLDFSFYGTTFLPLGKDLGGSPLRFPLPFAGPTLEFATIPAAGTAMHPHIQLSTKFSAGNGLNGEPGEIPSNTIREYTLFSHNSCFGDHFELNIPEFGGDGTGRSHLLGRLQLQFGERSGNTVPVAVSTMIAGGLLEPPASSPISQAFPGRLSPGPHGFDEFLRFPLRTYFMETVAFLDDPFDLSVGAVDVSTGGFIGELLHRGFISQEVFFALVRIEPRTPRTSFTFRGPAALQKDASGQTVFRLQAVTRVPYPEGFLFPQPDLANAYVVGPNSVLEPYFWMRGIDESESCGTVLQGGASMVAGSNGNQFSYRYKLSNTANGEAPFFEYVNHSQDGQFRLHSLNWIRFMNSQDAGHDGYDTLTFAGFGTWSKDGVEKTSQATVQICTSSSTPYVGIQIDGGLISDVNTKPLLLEQAKP